VSAVGERTYGAQPLILGGDFSSFQVEDLWHDRPRPRGRPQHRRVLPSQGGANYEFRLGEHSTFGASYLTFFADAAVKPDRDGMNVFNLRACELRKATWKPTFTYRYAFFQGDDPATKRTENFDPLLPGFCDWGYWWQGEIVGEYIARNSNLISSLVRAHVSPSDKLSGGLMFYNFTLDQPAALRPNVTSRALVNELDAYADWKINGNFTASIVAAFANPRAAAQQAFDRTKNFSYGMVFLAYSY
jgi:hypothetical protein